MIDQIPEELKTYNQFVMYKLESLEDGRLTKIPYCPQNGRKASPTNPSDWSSFAFAVQMLEATDCYSGIGFVLTENDPFVFIDLDNPYALDLDGQPKYPNAAEIMARQIEMFEGFQTYIERSPSGQGLHIIGRGAVPSGRKRDAIEVYSTARYMTMTGDVVKALPVSDINEWSNSLWVFLAPAKPAFATAPIIESQPEINTDSEICEMAYAASNGHKFLDLYSGRWNQHYTSQSDADFSLINILAFYTDSKEQVHRIFMNSALGQRPKAKRPDYMRAMLDRSFDRKIPQIDFSALKEQYENNKKPVEKIETSVNNPYTFPPGLVGDIASFIFEQAVYPSKEIALAGALGLMSGLCGRSYNVSGTGINNYIVLLAKTGRGKEAMSKGISRLLTSVKQLVPTIWTFKGPNEFASPQGLNKHLLENPCFVSIFGEFGLMLEQLNSKKAAPNIAGLRRMFLDLYNKSGNGQILDGIAYSDRDKNVKPVNAPAFSFLGECTPEKYYSLLDDGISTEGFLPRLTTIEFLGDRCEINERHHLAVPTRELVQKVAYIASVALQSDHSGQVRNVLFTDAATEVFKKYERFCGTHVNKKDVHLVHNEMWTRAYVKAMKLAALVAIGINYTDPVICEDCAKWAINIINYDNTNVIGKFENGEVGVNNSDSDQIRKLKEVCKNYVATSFDKFGKSHKGTKQMHNAGVVSYAYLQGRCLNLASFKNDKNGATGAFKKTIQSLIDSGVIQELNAVQSKTFASCGKCYAIVGEV